MRTRHLARLALAVIALPALAADDARVSLFNGKDLAGWTQRGGKAKYAVEGDEIVGTSVLNTPNSFLCTDKTFGNFSLEFDFKVDPRLNSGVQIRSECFDAPKEVEWQGRKIGVPAGRVHGYQIEIDPEPKKDRWWSGGLYDEGRRGWLYPGESGGDAKAFTAQGRKLFRQGDWNHIRVEALGDSIKTWLNGTPCADVRDGLTPRGFIALQVHGIGKDSQKEGAQVRWRNLKIREAAASGEAASNTLTEQERNDGWRLLWDGVTPGGWRGARAESFPARGWKIKDGILTVLAGGGQESAAGGDIITRDRFSGFELVADFRMTPGANSGIKYFVQPSLAPVTGGGSKAAAGSAIGCEFQLLDDALHPDAKQGRSGNRTLGSLYDLIPPAAAKQANPVGAWNTARIVVRGNHVEHWLNGAKIVEYERGSAAFRSLVAQSKYRNIPGFGEWPDGHILLQDHGDCVSFRNIKIRTPAEK